MAILALDLGTQTGVARGDPGAPAQSVETTTWRMPACGLEDVGPFMSTFESLLLEALSGVDVLIFEGPLIASQMQNMHTARRLIGMAAICEMHAHRRAIRCFECNIGTAKVALAGHGRAEKSDMIRAAKRRGFSPENNHEADALGVWLVAVGQLHPEQIHLYDPIFSGARG